MDERTAWLILMRAPGLHAGHLRSLLGYFGSVESIAAAAPPALAASRANSALIQYLQGNHDAQLRTDHEWLDQPLNTLVTWGSPRYPTLLTELNDAPVGLYVRGDPDALCLPQLAIVGARNP